MSVAFNPDTTADSISQVTITGVTVCDIDQIPESGEMVCPILFPEPEGWLSDVTQVNKGISVADAAQSDFTYVLHYVFLHSEYGGGVEGTDPYNDVVAKLKTIVQSILDNDTLAAAVEISLNTVETIGAVQDASGFEYWGALLSFKVTEYA